MAFWMPAFLERVRGVPKEAATVQFGLVVVVTGFVGTFAGRLRGRRPPEADEGGLPLGLRRRDARSPSRSPSSRSPSRTRASTSRRSSSRSSSSSPRPGPINSAIVNDVLPWQRAAAVAACNFTIHVLGDVPSPPLLGALSDASSLQSAVLLVPVAFLVGGAIWTWGALSGRRG